MKVSRTWTNETNNLTYFDGSTSFSVNFDLNGKRSIKATIPSTLYWIETFVDIRYGK